MFPSLCPTRERASTVTTPQATPQADTAMFYFYTEHLHFSAEFLGRVTLASKVWKKEKKRCSC